MRTAAFLLVVAAVCGKASAEAPTNAGVEPDANFFERKVRPLLAERCQRCHSSRTGKQKGGLLLDSRDSVLRGGDSGTVVVAGRPDQSLLIRAVRYEREQLQMPPGGKLTAAEIAVLEEWVLRGVPFPGGSSVAEGKKQTGPAAGRGFWSFRPPLRATAPAVRDAAWVRRPIDAFVLAGLESHGLAPSAPASRRKLIRRVSFDLTGLPPSPEDVERFVNDPAADAYERLVEGLLASPTYGERWARFWLDLARYCDVAEQWTENGGQPWLYRDWVVRAFNDDLPYARFVRLQLSADQLPDARPEDRAALGFLGLSPSYWKELKLAPGVIETVVAEEWEERINAVCGTFLGLTVACARCHDHKFDPVTQRDYYALAGVLASTRPAALSLLSEPALVALKEDRERLKTLESRVAKLEATKPAPPDVLKQIGALKADADSLKRALAQREGPLAPAVTDAALFVLPDGPNRTRLDYRPGVARDVALQIRGNALNPGPVVPRRFLAVLSPDPPRPFAGGSGRADLGRAIVTEGAPLAARVIVNRVWAQHFGAGLVETLSDFGAQGSRPSHPELLDDLAARFIGAGWSLKWLHREIVLSATYCQASDYDRKKIAVDPGNLRLWRTNRRRLEIEAWRDAMLAVAGTLDSQRGGPSLDLADPKNLRRTLYGTVKRRELSDLLRLNDFPDPTTHSPGRLPTITPLQQLFTLNGPLIRQQSVALARRLLAGPPCGVEDRVRRAYLLVYGRPATADEVRDAADFLAPAGPTYPVTEAAWQQYAQVLLGSNEFLFVD
jgi:hypothetical protein